MKHSTNPLKYTQYLHFKYRFNIEMLKYDSFVYNPYHTLALLFIDDRYDPLFPLLLRLFLYSLPNSECNLHIYCLKRDKKKYEKACIECKVYGTIFHILNEPIRDQNGYSILLSKYTFWKEIPEDYVLLFQYDSFVFDKMELSFLERLKKELYVGALWKEPIKHTDCLLWVGNGGTSFRNTRMMEIICRRFSAQCQYSTQYSTQFPKVEPEDVFFSKRLYDLKYKECSKSIAEKFSIENVYNDFSIYGHQIYLSIPYLDIENIWIKRLFNSR